MEATGITAAAAPPTAASLIRVRPKSVIMVELTWEEMNAIVDRAEAEEALAVVAAAGERRSDKAPSIRYITDYSTTQYSTPWTTDCVVKAKCTA